MSNNNAPELVSVIMPAYNSEKYIAQAINSVLEQSYLFFELIIIDDCSKDGTASIVKRMQDIDNRIKFYQNPVNKGVSKTRNHGILNAKGKWLAFLDSDDIWEKNKLEKQMSLLKQKHAEFVFTGASYINEKGECFPGIFAVPSVVDFKTLLRHNVISCSSVVVKKTFFEYIKMENDDIHEDYVVWLKILQTGISAYGINEPLLIYRISKSSKSGNKRKTIKMTYKVFRFIGMKPIPSVYYTMNHLLGSIKKYCKINMGYGK